MHNLEKLMEAPHDTFMAEMYLLKGHHIEMMAIMKRIKDLCMVDGTDPDLLRSLVASMKATSMRHDQELESFRASH